jgi:hypothetical protein
MERGRVAQLLSGEFSPLGLGRIALSCLHFVRIRRDAAGGARVGAPTVPHAPVRCTHLLGGGPAARGDGLVVRPLRDSGDL